MSAQPRLRYRLLRQLIVRSRSAQMALATIGDNLDRWTGALLNLALSNDEKEELSIQLYDDAFQPSNDLDGLYEWEERWFHRRLPDPPARIFVGAAGAGREARVLQARGYVVHALEPSPRAFNYCREVLGKDAVVTRASYRDLADAILDGCGPLAERMHGESFDAVLLGWGSFGHVLSPEARGRLLLACDKMTPDGPILLSIFEPPRQEDASQSELASNAAPAFVPWGGFLAEPSAEELATHARALGRELIAALDNSSPYFTLAPSTNAVDETADEPPPKPEREKSADLR